MDGAFSTTHSKARAVGQIRTHTHSTTLHHVDAVGGAPATSGRPSVFHAVSSTPLASPEVSGRAAAEGNTTKAKLTVVTVAMVVVMKMKMKKEMKMKMKMKKEMKKKEMKKKKNAILLVFLYESAC